MGRGGIFDEKSEKEKSCDTVTLTNTITIHYIHMSRMRPCLGVNMPVTSAVVVQNVLQMAAIPPRQPQAQAFVQDRMSTDEYMPSSTSSTVGK
jgi:hypothetical protein